MSNLQLTFESSGYQVFTLAWTPDGTRWLLCTTCCSEGSADLGIPLLSALKQTLALAAFVLRKCSFIVNENDPSRLTYPHLLSGQGLLLHTVIKSNRHGKEGGKEGKEEEREGERERERDGAKKERKKKGREKERKTGRK
jgi:hypothetical protein